MVISSVLRYSGWSICLTTPVPMPAAHIGERWFKEAPFSRSDAEAMLRRINVDGTFLVRESESSDLSTQSFAISFRAEGKIKHCRIKKEGRMFQIGDKEFSKLTDLVSFYETYPLYRKMKLRYALRLHVARTALHPSKPPSVLSSILFVATDTRWMRSCSLRTLSQKRTCTRRHRCTRSRT